jgi:AraC-like DNA-binding protein
MGEVEFRTDEFPRAERFAVWYEKAVEQLTPIEAHSEHAADFYAGVRCLDLGTVAMARLSLSPMQVERTPRLIRRYDPERYYLVLNLGGRFSVAQTGREATLDTQHDMVLYDTSLPYRTWTKAAASRNTVEKVMLQFPKSMLQLPAKSVDRTLAARLQGQEGLGALLSGAVREMAAGSGAHATRMAGIALDLLAAMLARQLEEELPPETHHRALLAQVHAFINRHLADPDLTPGVVAAAHHISLRHLHRLFGDQGMTVAGWIRERRLERCRHDLAALAEPVHVVAARWGFTDAAHFSRLFRSTYGMSPSDYRHAWSTSGRAWSMTR